MLEKSTDDFRKRLQLWQGIGKHASEFIPTFRAGTKDTQCASAKSQNVVTSGGKLNCVANIACEPDGGPSRRTHGNGLVRANTYDLDGRLTGISTTVPSSSALIQSLAYGFDANDTITAISNGANASLTQSFGYDELTRLTGVTSNSGNWTRGYPSSTVRSVSH